MTSLILAGLLICYWCDVITLETLVSIVLVALTIALIEKENM